MGNKVYKTIRIEKNTPGAQFTNAIDELISNNKINQLQFHIDTINNTQAEQLCDLLNSRKWERLILNFGNCEPMLAQMIANNLSQLPTIATFSFTLKSCVTFRNQEALSQHIFYDESQALYEQASQVLTQYSSQALEGANQTYQAISNQASRLFTTAWNQMPNIPLCLCSANPDEQEQVHASTKHKIQ